MLGFGILGGFVHSRRSIEGSIYMNTATTIIQGYIEQLKSMEFETLSENPVPTVFNEGTADPLTISPNVADVTTGNPSTDITNTKLIDLNNTPDTGDDLEIAIVAYIENLTDTAGGIGECRRISLRYTYTVNRGSDSMSHTNTVSSIRSAVPTF